MDPYEARPDKIPPTDRYINEPHYGRYFPQPADFKPDPRHINSTTDESLKYWASVLSQCDEKTRVYDNQYGGRDVLALGSVIVKSSHLKAALEGRRAHRDYSYADANEVEATALARSVLGDVQVPHIYFAGQIDGRPVLVQERIPGVGLNVAWQYISPSQKTSFKNQARDLLRRLHTIKPASSTQNAARSHLVPDPDPVDHRGIQELEKEILISDQNTDPDLGFMHNDFTQSNCIVRDDRIVGLVDWEMAGFFGWKTAAEVHVRIRSPKRENYAALDLPEEFLSDILFWNDLYEVDC
ncbi:uncharacterized protein EI97DRAFT_371953 [Westerdykella ornata]|uniref:Aminoglycoside phosphotransferase domain-containing protein n=1 Tax=Westerdykella ornata TaxID=318751 RepID=A0A6A6JUG0_WESOR|nr:uncharacterized protein EI97DRAFT_371953 [Westerdykella ornata]KAF2278679.1 hypothetical protein EI97DRAFT_371953 [Westerdykella ornata]